MASKPGQVGSFHAVSAGLADAWAAAGVLVLGGDVADAGAPAGGVVVVLPSTLGTFLRAFTHGHVQQPDAVSAQLLAGLADRDPGLIRGSNDDGIAFIDVDDTIGAVHGYAKQGAAFGYSGVRGLNLQLATISTPLAAPLIARARLRKGTQPWPPAPGVCSPTP